MKSLHSNTDISALAQEVVEKCNLVHKSKLPEVEQLIYYLQNRRKEAFNAGPKERPQTAFATEMPTVSNLNSPDGFEEVASLAKVEEYVDLLYEDIPEKVVKLFKCYIINKIFT